MQVKQHNFYLHVGVMTASLFALCYLNFFKTSLVSLVVQLTGTLGAYLLYVRQSSISRIVSCSI